MRSLATILPGLLQLFFHLPTVKSQDFVITGGGGATLLESYQSSEDRIYISPDPTNLSHLLALLDDPRLQVALEISKAQMEGVGVIQARLKESLMPFTASPGKDPEVVEEIFRFARENERIAASAVEEILKPSQLARLKQIAFRIEVARLGWADSLTAGRLGLAAGVYENQYAHIKKRTEEIMTEAEKQISVIKKNAESKILDELLSPEQRSLTRDCIGEFFDYKDLSLQQARLLRLKQEQQGKSDKRE